MLQNRFVQWRTQEFFFGGGSTNSVEDRGQRERGSAGGSPLGRGSGGNLIQEISFHMVKFSSFLVLHSYVTSCLGEKRKYHCGGHSWRGGIFTKQLKK
jgi:hypothetical protein